VQIILLVVDTSEIG